MSRVWLLVSCCERAGLGALFVSATKSFVCQSQSRQRLAPREVIQAHLKVCFSNISAKLIHPTYEKTNFPRNFSQPDASVALLGPYLLSTQDVPRQSRRGSPSFPGDRMRYLESLIGHICQLSNTRFVRCSAPSSTITIYRSKTNSLLMDYIM